MEEWERTYYIGSCRPRLKCEGLRVMGRAVEGDFAPGVLEWRNGKERQGRGECGGQQWTERPLWLRGTLKVGLTKGIIRLSVVRKYLFGIPMTFCALNCEILD